jgi:hypothetical protein
LKPWVARAVVVVVVVAAAALAFVFRPLLAPRMAQNEASHYLLARDYLTALDVAALQLQKTPDNGELKALAQAAADEYVRSLEKEGKKDEAREWLARQIALRPYLKAPTRQR